MCVIVDHYTRMPLAVFDSRYGQEKMQYPYPTEGEAYRYKCKNVSSNIKSCL